jgi:ABC-2 type transport system ATP-binding protein
VISARHLSRTFDARSVVEDVTFEVKAGEIFGLLGPNGAGKTTTLRMIAGLIAPTSGEASVAGVPLTSRTIDHVRHHVGFLTEAPGLWERLSVRTNLLTYARLHQVTNPAATVNAALERFGLADRADNMAVELSKGLKQRVALARTLLHNPPVVLLDEPTSGLDPHSARLVRDMVLELRARGHAIIISTHNLDEAERVADRVGVLRRRFLAVATPGELRHRLFGSRVRITVLDDPTPFASVAVQAGADDVAIAGNTLTFAIQDVDLGTPAVVRALVFAGASILSVRTDHQPLEEVYLALVADDSAGERAS